MEECLNEELVVEFMNDYDISVGYDLFGAYFFHDPLCVYISPNFITMEDLEKFIVTNYEKLKEKLSC